MGRDTPTVRNNFAYMWLGGALCSIYGSILRRMQEENMLPHSPVFAIRVRGGCAKYSKSSAFYAEFIILPG